jgi:hypothetical protein
VHSVNGLQIGKVLFEWLDARLEMHTSWKLYWEKNSLLL